ncbi:DUF3566 domain-containing protein [Streptomyces broussonetiae]|nr:DUF3566 domain-containing protein [Streptomyces broussonetiae]
MSRARRSPRGTTPGRLTPERDGGLRIPLENGSAAERQSTVRPDAAEERTAPGARLEERSAPQDEPAGVLDHDGSPSTPSVPFGPAPEPSAPVGPARVSAALVGSAPGSLLPVGPDQGQVRLPRSAAPATGPSRRPAPAGLWTIRLRISEGGPWSVMLTSFLLLAGLGVIAVVTAVVVWYMMEAMAPDVLPKLSTVLGVGIGVVCLEVVLGTCLATLGTFIYNLSVQYNGGLEVVVTNDLGPTPAAARALRHMARARLRTRRYLRTHTPVRAAHAVGRLPVVCRPGRRLPLRPPRGGRGE